MAISILYYTILNKPFFIDLRRIDAQAVLIDKFLERDIADMTSEKLSEKSPVDRLVASEFLQMYESGNTTVKDFNKAPEGSVAVVSLRGDMLKEGTMCSYGTEEIAAVIREAASSPKIIGIRLDIDSGGGAVDAIAPMLDAIRYTQENYKPVVACCDLCASAAYYVACHCNLIIADNNISAEFGSIGVMMQFPDYAKYYEKMGIKVHTIYSDLSTHKNAPFEAALKGDYKSIKEEQLNPLAREFQKAVKEHRKNLDTKVDGILNGRMFFAADALKNGLIDQIGTRDQATQEVRRLAANMSLANYAAEL